MFIPLFLTLLLFALATCFLPLFDSSPRIIASYNPFLRWDSFFFAHIAQHGYVYEKDWAFLPGLPLVMRSSAAVIRLVLPSDPPLDLLWGGALAAIACDSSCTLYHLSLHHLKSPTLAFVASTLSLMSSSPATLRFTPYTEPFFTFWSYKGMLCCARSQWFLASVFFTLAGAFRSNGVLLSGFIIWGLIIQPLLERKRPSFKDVTYAILLSSITFAPFAYHNYSAYLLFCTGPSPSQPPWCHNFPPTIYAHVQSKYWNVGILRYWTVQQLPNFLISAPPLVALFAFSAHLLRNSLLPNLTALCLGYPAPIFKSPFLSLSLIPHAIHAFIFCAILLFASHTQIILRLAASMPFTYWSAAWLVVEHPKFGRWWVGWSIVWGAVSVVLWSVFLPPA